MPGDYGGGGGVTQLVCSEGEQTANLLELCTEVDKISHGGRYGNYHGLHQGAIVEFVAGATDGEALLVEQFPNTTDQENFMMLVVATVTASLDRLELGEFLLPIPQDMGLYTTQLANFPNREIALGGNRRQGLQQRLGCAVVHCRKVKNQATCAAFERCVAPSTMALSF